MMCMCKKKTFRVFILIFILTQCLATQAFAITFIGKNTNANTNLYSDDWKYWSQGATQYINTKMQSSGCRVVAQAKLLMEAGIASNDPDFTPDTYVIWANNHGYFGSDGKSFKQNIAEQAPQGQAPIGYANSIGKSLYYWGEFAFSSTSIDKQCNTILDYLNQGYFVILARPTHHAYVGREQSLAEGIPVIFNSKSDASVSDKLIMKYPDYAKEYAPFTSYRLYSTTKPTDNTTTAPIVTTVVTDTATEITETSVRLNSSLTIVGGTGHITKHGMYFGTDPSRLTIIAEDVVDYNKSSLTMFYRTTKYGPKLEPGTTYYYQAYAVINGAQHTGEVRSFITPISAGVPPTPSVSPKISLSSTSLTMKDDVCRELEVTTTPSGQKVTWRSSNTSVATVETGKITGRNPGTTTITAEMTYEGKTYSATCEVTVTASECTTHTKGTFLRYDSEHPHYNYYTCSKCGETFKDSSTSTASNCMICASCTVSTNSVSNVTSTSAQLNGSLSASSNVKITEHGAYLGTSPANMVLMARDYVNYSKSSLTMFYSTTKYGPTLQPGTTYYYYCYAIVNGEKIDGSVVSFTTPEERTNAYVSTNSASNVTSTSAQLNGSLSASGNVKITEHGAYLGTSQYNMYRVAQDTVNYNKSSLTMFYNTEKYGTRLEPGTTYYYYCYAVINGETIRGSVVSFKTSAVNTGGQGTTATYYVSGTNGALAINSQPSSGYQIGRIPEGEACTVYPNLASGNWYWVEYNGVSGYAYKSYLSSVKPSTSGSVPSSSNTRTGIVTGTDGKNLAINSRPSSGYQIGRIPPGASMTVYPDKTSGNWYWVEYNGVSGYAYSKYITLQ